MRFLAAADIHLGRIPALPDPFAPVTGRSAWEAVVQCALDQEVDVLLLAGDVVEQDNAWFEAYGALLKGLDRLQARGIRVIAVAGNHDAQVFPRVVQDSGALTLLGAHGRWEAAHLEGISILGWSFPAQACTGNPLASLQAEALCGGRPYLGLLHGDLEGAPGSRYAPFPATALEAEEARLWVLGHIHRGGPRAGDKALYCGSPFALHAKEEGTHGAWLLESDATGWVAPPRLIPLSPWEFITLSVDLTGTERVEEVQDRIGAACRTAAAEAQGHPARTLYTSLHLHGACALAGTLEGLLRNDLQDLQVDRGGITVRPFSRITDATDPLLDLPSLARDRGTKASLARLLLQAQDPGAPLDELPGVLGKALALNPGSKAEARDLVALAARRLLTALIRQERGA